MGIRLVGSVFVFLNAQPHSGPAPKPKNALLKRMKVCH